MRCGAPARHFRLLDQQDFGAGVGGVIAAMPPASPEPTTTTA